MVFNVRGQHRFVSVSLLSLPLEEDFQCHHLGLVDHHSINWLLFYQVS